MNIGALPADVMFIMSMPRLAFTDNMYCAMNVTRKLGLYGQRHCGVFWEQGVENLLEDATGLGYKYALTIDYDTYFTEYTVIDLYNLMEANPDVDLMFPIQPRRGNEYPMAANFEDEDGHLVKISKGRFTNGIVECDTGHFGLTMVRLESLKRLAKPWFESKPDAKGGWRRGHKDADTAFWIKCKKEGLKVALAEVWIGHMELKCAWSGPEQDGFKTVYMEVNEIIGGNIPLWAAPKCITK